MAVLDACDCACRNANDAVSTTPSARLGDDIS